MTISNNDNNFKYQISFLPSLLVID